MTGTVTCTQVCMCVANKYFKELENNSKKTFRHFGGSIKCVCVSRFDYDSYTYND